MAFALLSPPNPLNLPFKSPKPTSPPLHFLIPPLHHTLSKTSGHWQRHLFLAAQTPPSEVAEIEEKNKTSASIPTHEEPEVPYREDLEDSLLLLKRAGKSRKVPSADVLSAIAAIKNAKVDASSFLEILGGSESPGRTWMLIFTAQGRLDEGRYFPVTAVQRFDAEARRIENGIYLGPIGRLTFEGKFSWTKKKILAFIFEYLLIQIGPLGPFKISLGKQEREPSTTKDPFFIWYYIDKDIAVAQGRGGGVALWCRCRQVR